MTSPKEQFIEEFKEDFKTGNMWNWEYAQKRIIPWIEDLLNRHEQLIREEEKEEFNKLLNRFIIHPEPMAEGSDVDDYMITHNNIIESIKDALKNPPTT